MDFKILGPLEIVVGAERLDLGGSRQQVVVATLLLSANKVVALDRLLEAIYGEELPPTARAQAQISISSLRRTFASASDSAVLTTHAQGYVIAVEPGRLDSERFEELVGAARAAREAGNPHAAMARYRDALRLWRGPALDGIDSPLLSAAAHRLDEQRLATTEERLSLELELGRHHELVGELSELVEKHPLRERLRGQLMLALYRCDQAAEARAVYRQAEHIMNEELGIDPSEHLRKLDHAIRGSAPALALPSQTTVPRQVTFPVPSLLPADIADFTGRTAQLEQARRYLANTGGDVTRGAAPIVVITGRGGTGKTSLCVHAAHEIAESFPDGQLFANMHGAVPHPVSPMQVLERFLRVLGLPGAQLPEGLDARAEVYRNMLAGRKVLVVLDDVASESQVSPLIPGDGTAAMMITSRSRLGGLADPAHIEVDVFDAEKSLELLVRIVGADRVATEPEAAATVAEHCAHLPLALRIAGARLAARPHWRIQRLAGRLADETRRLDELRHGDMGIRPSISLSYESAGKVARRLLRRLALLDVPCYSSWLASVLIEAPLGRTEDLLDDLVSAQLIEVTGCAGLDRQYRLHDLVRVFARERLAVEETAAERKDVLEHALGALLYLADEAHARYYGGDYARIPSEAPRMPLPRPLTERLVADPLAWYERERATLISGVRQAAQAGLAGLCWGLAFSAVALFEARAYLDDWQETHEIALDAARKAHDVRGQAAMLYSTGSLHMVQQRPDPARRELTMAAQLFTDAGDVHGVAHVTRHIAYLDRMNGKLADATARYEQALAILRDVGDKIATACALHHLAQVKLELHQPGEAIELLSEALELCQVTRCERIEAQVLYRMGEVWLQTGELASAIDAFGRTLSITSGIGDFIGQAYALLGSGVALTRQGAFGEARDALRRALELARSVNERMAQARALLGRAELALACGDPRQAATLSELASDSFHLMQAPLYEVQALTLLGSAHTALGDAATAEAVTTSAAALRVKVLGDEQAS
ncbi:MAG TPA: BTAD domain-containing putative transcriptional regulator [Streptosporangiaceae bacterium]